MTVHITTEEVALASVAIGGLIGIVSGSIRDRSGERRDHLTRLWEKEIEIYESLLLQVSATRTMYREIRGKFEGTAYGARNPEFPVSGLDKSIERRLPIQLVMFGRDDVQRAYEEYERLGKDAVISLAQVKNASDDVIASAAVAATRGELSGNLDRPLREWPEVASRISELSRILDAIAEADSNLTEVIGMAVRGVPSAGRRQRWPKFLGSKAPLSTVAIKSDFWERSDH
jgi:hypothetical protein